jgi:hypothetical protein
MNEGLKITGDHKLIFKNIFTGEERIVEYKNIIVTVGLSMIAERLAGGSNNCDITYTAVGTDATAPALGDTTLGTELDRKAVTTISNSGTQVLISTFFGASEAIGTLTELGYFGEAASATPDSGTMFNHAVISEVKTASETLTIQSTFTMSN